MPDYIWNKVSESKPREGSIVLTKIDDSQGVRNEGLLMYKSNLWWSLPDFYVYYTPTHWRLNKE